jgi:hypothetical protein
MLSSAALFFTQVCETSASYHLAGISTTPRPPCGGLGTAHGVRQIRHAWRWEIELGSLTH